MGALIGAAFSLACASILGMRRLTKDLSAIKERLAALESQLAASAAPTTTTK